MPRVDAPTLRRRNPELLPRPGATEEPAVQGEAIEVSEVQSFVPKVANIGAYYIILGDSLEGYYLVKCLSIGGETFYGKYLAVSNEILEEKVVYREMSDCDTFQVRTIVTELNIKKETFGKKTFRLSVLKSELDEVLLTLSEFSDI